MSTQPVDKSQRTEVIPHLRDSGFFILHPLDRDEPGLRENVSALILISGGKNGKSLHGELSLALQESGVGLHESVRLNVLDGNTTHFVGIGEEIVGLGGEEAFGLDGGCCKCQ